MRIGLSWCSGKKEYRYAGMGGAHASGERESVDIEEDGLVYTRTFEGGGDGVAVVGYCAAPGEPVAPIGNATPTSQVAIPLTVAVRPTREVIASADELAQLDGIEVESERRWVRVDGTLRYANADDGATGGGDGSGDRQKELCGPGQNAAQSDSLGGFADIFEQMENEAQAGFEQGGTAQDEASDALSRAAVADWFSMGR